MAILDILHPVDICLFILSIIFLMCIKKDKIVLSLPLTLNLFFISYYNFIDTILMRRAMTINPFGGRYNYDYTRLIISFIMTLIMFFLSIYLSKKIESKKVKIVYITAIFLFNIILAYITYVFHQGVWIS